MSYYRPSSEGKVPLVYKVSVLMGIAFCVWFTVVTWPANPVGNFVESNPTLQQILHVTKAEAQRVNVAAPSHGESIIGGPSLTPELVNRVLALANSPASGTGQALYDLSQQYNIDDAYALAFFQHESSFGTTGVAQFTRSLGNIRCSSGYACIDGFRAYASWEAGYADWYQLIRTLYIGEWHLTTVAQIIPVYAPTSDGNNVSGYIAAIEQAVNQWRRGKV
jgi:Mannosyl-glycoprotein endo-beta-N-acetylglucosaminidase